jgi:predicted metal-dependent peptidase
LECDTRITSVTDYDGKKIPEIKGRGGTLFEPPIKYYYDHRKEYATLIYFTDGGATIPSKCPSNMVWIISSCGLHQDYPGKAIYIPQSNK